MLTSDLVRDTHSNTYYVRVRGVSLCVVCMCECAAKASARADLREETESALRRQRILGFFPKLSLSLALSPLPSPALTTPVPVSVLCMAHFSKSKNSWRLLVRTRDSLAETYVRACAHESERARGSTHMRHWAHRI